MENYEVLIDTILSDEKSLGDMHWTEMRSVCDYIRTQMNEGVVIPERADRKDAYIQTLEAVTNENFRRRGETIRVKGTDVFHTSEAT